MESKFVTIAHACPFCGKEEFHLIPVDGYFKWKIGVLIQTALPDSEWVNECVREFLITGFCANCREENDRIAKRAEREETETHDGVCRCGAIVECLEGDCHEHAGHEYPCDKCLMAEQSRSDPFDLMCERRFD